MRTEYVPAMSGRVYTKALFIVPLKFRFNGPFCSFYLLGLAMGQGPVTAPTTYPRATCLSFCTSGNDKFWETKSFISLSPLLSPAPGTHLTLSVKRPWGNGTRTLLWAGGGLFRELSARLLTVE